MVVASFFKESFQNACKIVCETFGIEFFLWSLGFFSYKGDFAGEGCICNPSDWFREITDFSVIFICSRLSEHEPLRQRRVKHPLSFVTPVANIFNFSPITTGGIHRGTKSIEPDKDAWNRWYKY